MKILNFSWYKHCKEKEVFYRTRQKRFRRFLKASKGAQSLKKHIKKSTKPLKVLLVYAGEDPSPTKPFFKFLTGEKGLYKIFRVSYYTLMVSY
jgi:hypothetical protein